MYTCNMCFSRKQKFESSIVCFNFFMLKMIQLSSRCFKKNIPKEVVQGNMNSGFEEEVELADTRRKR